METMVFLIFKKELQMEKIIQVLPLQTLDTITRLEIKKQLKAKNNPFLKAKLNLATTIT
jgi:hypothetical protein